jgi:hypothetical protein
LILSKSQYLKGVQCQKALWLYRYRPDLKPEVSESQQFLFDSGHEIGKYAQQYFSGGIEIETDYFRFDKATEDTRKAIDQGHNVIFEASACSDDGGYCRIDILKRVEGTDSWDLIEVKGSTGVKDYHIDDLTFQRLVFLNAGFNIRKSVLMHINNQYQRRGEIDVKAFFTLVDLTEIAIEGLENASKNFRLLQNILQNQVEPVIDIGDQCHSPFPCQYLQYCWKNIPDYSVYNVAGRSKLSALLDMNIIEISDIPNEFDLTNRQRIDVDSHKTQQVYVNKESIAAFLKDIEYPIYFLDYETIMPAIPLYDKTKPYQQIPFQYSLHIKQTNTSRLDHIEFLHTEKGDPRPYLIKSLIEAIGPKESILVYNRAFESRINNELGIDFPEYKKELDTISDRFVDLLIPFRSRYIYHPNMRSSASIKSVLPAFFPEMSYDNLDIGDGGTASLRYLTYAKGELPESEEKKLFESLRDYCKQDTLAEVKLLSLLEQISKDGQPQILEKLKDKLMHKKKAKTVEQLKISTKKFFELHWNWEQIKVDPKNDCRKIEWEIYEGMKGEIPYGKCQGCYAVVQDDELIYIGLGASRGYGKYKEHGIGARIGHIIKWDRSNTTLTKERVYIPKEHWQGITAIYTFGLPSGYGYLASSLEAYLIREIEPVRNIVKTASKSDNARVSNK